MNPKSYADILGAVAADHMPARLDLFPRLSAPLEKKSLMQTMRTRPVLALVLVVLALLMLTGVVYALGRLAGFIPGFGFSPGAVGTRGNNQPGCDHPGGTGCHRHGQILAAAEPE